MTPRYGWTTFTLCYLIIDEEQQKLQQLGVLRNLYVRNLLPHKPQHTVEDVGKSMLKRQKLKSGSAVIFVTSVVENVKTYRLYLLLILIFVKNVVDVNCVIVLFVLFHDTEK